MTTLPELYSIGSVAGKHGFKGAVNIKLLDESYHKILKKGTYLFLSIEGKGVPFFIEQILFEGCLQLDGINTEELAQELNGREVMVELSRVKKKTPTMEILGFSILNASHENLGKIKRTETYPAGDMLFIENPAGEEWMLPLVESWLIDVNVKDRIILMNIPDGLNRINEKDTEEYRNTDAEN